MSMASAANKQADSPTAQTPKSPLRRRLVFTDPVAFRYLEEDPTTVVLERHARLPGYELYIVEQWACSRIHPTFIIATYTGDPSHSVQVGVLAVPADEATWSDRLRVYYKAVAQFHARLRDTPLGGMMVTNLSSFPSALTVIPVPDGEPRKHREDFIVNENLKRLGCSGRAGLNLAPPPAATAAKFHQLYRTSDSIALYPAVIELVKLCQVALLIFDKLSQEYADGLLCDVTEKAINDWWTETGSEYYNTEPSDGILGPTTVAGLLGMMMGARNRLNYLGAPVPKDVFDIPSLKRGIGSFQKQQKLERTRRLDRETLDRLRRVTAKAAAGEGWTVPKTVKSTVAELSGKGGEMVMGIVGSRDKSGIGDVETLDYDRFVSLVTGERSKWLWHGKSRRSNVNNDTFGQSLPELGNMIFGKDDQGGYVWTSKGHDAVSHDLAEAKKHGEEAIYSARPPGSVTSISMESPVEREKDKEKEVQLRRTVLKNVADKMNDARSGFGRIKGAVGFRGHTNKHFKDESGESDVLANAYSSLPTSANVGSHPNTGLPSSPGSGHLSKAFTWKNKPEEYQNGFPKELNKEKSKDSVNNKTNLGHRILSSTSSVLPQSSGSGPSNTSSITTPFPPQDLFSPEEVSIKEGDAETWEAQRQDIRRELVISDPSVAGSFDDVAADLAGPCLDSYRDPDNFSILLRRRNSLAACPIRVKPRNDAWWPRHLSFSDAEDAVLSWTGIGILDNPDEQDAVPGREAESGALDADDLHLAATRQRLLATELTHLYTNLSALSTTLSPFLHGHLRHVAQIERTLSANREYYAEEIWSNEKAYHKLEASSKGMLDEERGAIESVLAALVVEGRKLEYEVDALGEKVTDVEEAVEGFERLVGQVEARMVEMAGVMGEREGGAGYARGGGEWLRWLAWW